MLIGTKFKGFPYIGISGNLMKEINGRFCVGILAGLQFYSGIVFFVFRIPIMTEERYFVSGSADRFYPVANLDFVHSQSKTTGLIEIKVYSTNFVFALGAGVNFGSVVFSVKNENIQDSIVYGELFNFKFGLWMGESEGKL